MTAPSFDVAMFKVLRYAYDCMKADAHPDIDKARELSGVGGVYFTEIIQSCVDAGYLRRVEVREYRGGQDPMVLASPTWGITREGAHFVDEDKFMKKAAEGEEAAAEEAPKAE